MGVRTRVRVRLIHALTPWVSAECEHDAGCLKLTLKNQPAVRALENLLVDPVSHLNSRLDASFSDPVLLSLSGCSF